VVILGQLLHSNSNKSEINGYIYQHNHTNTNVATIVQPSNGVIYDIMGRKWNDIDNLPAGIYIINTNEGVKKIHINKQ
jgi:hypothetical protein